MIFFIAYTIYVYISIYSKYIYILYIIQYIGCLGDMYSKLIPISYLSHWFGTTVLLSSFAPGTSSARPHPYNSAGLLVLWGPWDG